MSFINIIKILPLLVLLNNTFGLPRVDPLVNTNVGLIRGLRATDGDYSMFLGIPFAMVDEANPFGPSIPYPEFEDTFEAYDDSAICPQLSEFTNTIVGTLDCLHLNIYVPSTASSRNKLPVLVWIYGGGFSIGFSGRYIHGPKYLVKNDVILVTLNYRLGPYGFMCLDRPEIPGNQGLKDQLSALRWINNNIEAFGGDVNKITIFGESAGGVSVDLHLLFNQENLFNKVIIQSGTSLSPFAVQPHDTEVPLKLAVQLGFQTDNVDEALQYLGTVDSDLVIAASLEQNLSLRPCVEQEFENVENYINKYPVNLNFVRNIPILLGFNNHEWLAAYENRDSSYYENVNRFSEALSESFTFDNTDLNIMEEIVRHFYIGDEKISIDIKSDLVDFDSDLLFAHPTSRTIEKYFAEGAQTIFQYMFSYVGERNFVKRRLNITIGGAAHADEIGYLFDVSFMTEEPTLEDEQVIERLTTLWTNFAKYGDPTPETSELLPVKWAPVTREIQYYLDIDKELSLKARPFNKRMAFWDLFYKLNQKYVVGYEEN